MAELSEERKSRLLVAAVIALFCVTLAICPFIPAYIDDTLYLIVTARAGYDGWQAITEDPQCGAGFATAIPALLLPGRWLSWVLQYPADSFFGVRLISVAITAAWMCYAAWFVKKCMVPSQPLPAVLAGVIGLVGLGTFPVAMNLDRPEAAMGFAITFYASLPFLARAHPNPSRGMGASVCLIFFAVTSWFLSIHIKALFYVPLLLVSACSLIRWHKMTGWLLTGLSVLTCYQSWHDYWGLRMICPDSAGVRNFMATEAIFPSLLFTHFSLFLGEVTQNIIGGIVYVRNIIFPVEAWQWWLPHAARHGSLSLILQCVASLFIIEVVAYFLWQTGAGTVRMVRDATQRKAWRDPAFLIPLCLLAAALVQWGLQIDKKISNFLLIWVTLLMGGLTTALYLKAHTSWGQEKMQQGALRFSHLLTISVLSQGVLLMLCVPALVSEQQQFAANGEIRFDNFNEWYLINTLPGEKVRSRILYTAKSCHITPDRSSEHIAVDTVTYMPLKETYQPLRLVFRFHDYDTPPEFFSFLRKWHSSGVVALCEFLPDKIRALAKEHEGVCCIPREQITGP